MVERGIELNKVTLFIKGISGNNGTGVFDACVLFYWWRNKWKFGRHFVTVQYKDDCFVGYNTYSNSKGPDFYGDSLEQFLKRRKYFWAMLSGVKK